MPLTMRPTGLGHGVYKDIPDYSIFCGEWCIWRIYETRTGPADLRWFWALHAPGGREPCAPQIGSQRSRSPRPSSSRVGSSGRRGRDGRSLMRGRLFSVLSWVLAGLAVLVLLFGWPFMIWRAVDSGFPFVPAVLDSLLWPTAAMLILGCCARLSDRQRWRDLRPSNRLSEPTSWLTPWS
jgi:hypothetical protein